MSGSWATRGDLTCSLMVPMSVEKRPYHHHHSLVMISSDFPQWLFLRVGRDWAAESPGQLWKRLGGRQPNRLLQRLANLQGEGEDGGGPGWRWCHHGGPGDHPARPNRHQGNHQPGGGHQRVGAAPWLLQGNSSTRNHNLLSYYIIR